MNRFRALLPVVIFLWMAGSFYIPVSFAQEEQDLFTLDDARILLNDMTPEERVGQLFLVTFEGSQIEPNSDVVRLILESHIGGIVLSAENNNFSDGEDGTAEIARLTNGLQELALLGRSSRIGEVPFSEDSGDAVDELTPTDIVTDSTLVQLPILVGTTHGGGAHSELLSGLTELPSQLALGATWDPQMSELIGQVAGAELNSLGFNLLLNPSLNVVEKPDLLQGIPSTGLIDSFGGNAYWVGEFGAAFVTGVKNGSDGSMLVIGGNFPGSGSSDRALNSEVATVLTSLLDLQQSELLPFTEVADQSRLTETIDGFMTAHLRYHGLQGNIDERTAPLSFDAQAIETLLQLGPLADWRAAGGLLVSGELGVSAIQRFYATEEDPFPHRRVARDALLAGNDLLYIGNFSAENDPAIEFSNVQDTLDWFVEQYSTDSTFRARVDEAVLRVLLAKIRLYDSDFSLSNVLIDEVSAGDNIGNSSNLVDMIALDAVAQLAPLPQVNSEPLPRPPNRDDAVVIFIDSRSVAQCDRCSPTQQPEKDGLQNQILKLYGPDASNQVDESQITSFTFDDLAEFLDAASPVLAPTVVPISVTRAISEPVLYPTDFLVQEALLNADWVVFASQGIRGDVPSSDAMNRLLASRPGLLSGRIVTVFSLGYPLDLDATDTSQITAYYGLYSHGQAFIDAAARVLFRELPARGASPISIGSVGYDLDQVTSAQPSQVIELSVEEINAELNEEPSALSPGDTLRLRTGVIVDYNGNPVPDGTLVQFTQEDRVQGFYSVIAEVFTVDGRANFDYVLEDRAGLFRLRAESGAAITSAQVDIAINENDSAQIEVVTPTPAPTFTPTPSLVPTQTETPEPSPTSEPTATPIPVPENEEPQINITLSELQALGSLFLGLFSLGWVGNLTRSETRPMSGRLRKILWGLLFGLVGYIWFFTGMPGAGYLPDWGVWRWMFVTIGCGLPGIGVAWLFNQIFEGEE